ncbi:MAG: 4-(cytidine 5'-diphospho)-2-C-methyl-D-erythritol kinase [Bacteroidales bacterium]|nr:4-(cytidine 5'-diphospho)-2-C-methyl-D-erythritol kinase [Bacteroidales bacterium]
MISYPNVKINLGLSVIRKRPDGFHDIETLFVPYHPIHDTLEITPSETFSITIEKDGGADWDPMTDLTVRAYNLLREDFGIPPVAIRLVKTSPVGAGLGGGSSDAAFALRMLSDMFALGLSDEALAGYAARLGSDCALFVYNRPMIGRGRGEILTPYDLRDIDYGQPGGESLPYRLEVTVPEGISVSTAAAYRGIVPALPAISIEKALEGPVEGWKDTIFNDFETTVFKAFPALAELKAGLYASGAAYASMSGSGSSVYSIVKK